MTPTPKQISVPKPPPAPSKMTLASITRGLVEGPWRILAYGVEGLGKSTLGAGTPRPIFLASEDGTGHLDVERFPKPESWRDVLDAVTLLAREKHDYKTLVIDTLDWVEPLCWAHVCARDSKANIEDYGFGKGYQTALDEWRLLLSKLEALRPAGVNVMVLAHSTQKTWKNPEGDDFDRFELKVHAKAGGLFKEWSDAVLFANHETFAKKNEQTKRVKGVSTGARLLFTERTAAYDAKNRYGLPPFLALSWPELEAAMKAGRPADPAALIDECKRKAAELGGEDETKVLEALPRSGNDAAKLSQLNNWCNAQLTRKAEQAGKAV